MYIRQEFTTLQVWEHDQAGLERRRRAGEFWMRRGMERETARSREQPGAVRRFLAAAGGMLVAFGRKLQDYGMDRAAVAPMG